MTPNTIDTDRLVALREARAWTQEDLAQGAGLSARTVQRTEAGEPPSTETLRALSAAFDVHPNMLRAYRMPPGLKWGMIGAFAGLLIGPGTGFAALWMAASEGTASGQSVGVYAGLWGLALGVMASVTGMAIGRDQLRFREGRLARG